MLQGAWSGADECVSSWGMFREAVWVVEHGDVGVDASDHARASDARVLCDPHGGRGLPETCLQKRRASAAALSLASAGSPAVHRRETGAS